MTQPLPGRGESTPLPRISIQQPDPGWLSEFQAGPAPGSTAAGAGPLPPGPGAPHFRPKPPGLIAGTTAVLASTAPRGPSSVVSSDCGDCGTPRRGPESLARPPRPTLASTPGWKAEPAEQAWRRRRLPNCSRALVVGSPYSAPRSPWSSVAETLSPQRAASPDHPTGPPTPTQRARRLHALPHPRGPAPWATLRVPELPPPRLSGHGSFLPPALRRDPAHNSRCIAGLPPPGGAPCLPFPERPQFGRPRIPVWSQKKG